MRKFDNIITKHHDRQIFPRNQLSRSVIIKLKKINNAANGWNKTKIKLNTRVPLDIYLPNPVSATHLYLNIRGQIYIQAHISR